MSNTNDYYSKPSERRESKSPRRTLYRPLTFFLIIVAIIFTMSVFFKVANIEVSGNSKYSKEEIISASGIHTGDNLFFINRIGAGSRVVVKLPYVDSVKITRSLPNSVTITVEESKAAACIQSGDELWSISSTGKFLSRLTEKDARLLPKVTGVTASDAQVGEIISVSKDDKAKLDYLLEILYQVQARSLVEKVANINVSDVNDASFEYDERFVVKLGENNNTEYKFGKLLSAVAQLKADDAGTLEISDSNKVTFRPN